MALAPYGLVLWNESFPGKTNLMQLQWAITTTKTVSPLPISNSAVYTTFDAIASQSVIDNFLLTSSEFLVAAFDSTSMGTDTFGCLVKMNGLTQASTDTTVGQCASVESMIVTVNSGTGGTTQTVNGVIASSSLTSTTNSTQIAVGADGDIAFRFISSGIDILTTGVITVNIFWTSK